MKKIGFFSVGIIFWVNAFSQITFQTVMGGAGDEYVWGVCQASDGGYIVGGFTQSFGAGSSDIYICKTDSDGNVLWKNTFGGTNAEEGNSIVATADGGCILAGWTNSFGAGGQDVYILKTDNTGNLVWSKTIGGIGGDAATVIKAVSGGGYVIAGSTSNFSAVSIDIYLMKTDSSGNLLWTKTYGGANYDVAVSIYQTTDGGFIIGGYTNSYGAGSYDACLLKTDSAGNLLWAKAIGGAGADYAQTVTQAIDGGFVFAGQTNSFGFGNYDIYLGKTDTAGNLLWSRTIGTAGGETATSMLCSTDGGFLMAGNTQLGAGGSDARLLKTDSAGNFLWSKAFGGLNDDYGNAVSQTSDGAYIIGARTRNFGAGNTDVYLIKTVGDESTSCYETNVHDSESVPVTVVTPAAMSVSSGGIVNNVPTISGSNGTDTSVCFLLVGIQMPFGGGLSSVKLFPNPATNEITIYDERFTISEVEMFNAVGEKIFEKRPTSNLQRQTISIADFPPSIYFITVTDQAGNKVTKKVVKI